MLFASATRCEDVRKLVRRYDLELRVGAIARLLVGAPPSKLRGVTKAAALHVVVSHLDHQIGAKRFPGEILALAPATLCAGYPTARGFGFADHVGPVLPRVIVERAFAVRRQELHELAALLVGEAG